jgi:hypothetical protein
VILVFILVLVLVIYLYGKWYTHNYSVKRLQRSARSKSIKSSNLQRKISLVPPPPPPPPRPPLPHPPKADEDLTRDEGVSPHPIFADYLISYCDSNGIKTERRITIQRIDGDLVNAYCHLRHGKRSFYISRVSKWINCDSGEVISDIAEDLDAAKKNSAYGTVERMFEDLYPIMGVLLYLCKGDKRLMIEERNVLIKVFQTICNDSRLTDEMINNGINEMKTPSRTRFRGLVKELSEMKPEIRSIAFEASKQIFSSRKTLNPIEEEGLNELNKRLTGKQ